MGEEVTKYQSLCQQLMAETEHLKKVGVSQQQTNAEVEKIFHIPLEPFLKTEAKDPDPSHNRIQEMYTFEYENQVVWGASARILKQIHSCVKS